MFNPTELEEARVWFDEHKFIANAAMEAANADCSKARFKKRHDMFQIALWAIENALKNRPVPCGCDREDRNELKCHDCGHSVGAYILFCPECFVKHRSPDL